MTEPQPDTSQRGQSLRLVFSYEGDEIRLESTQTITMAAPPSDLAANAPRRPAFWSEVRDAQSSVLYRRALHNPVRRYVEVFPEDPEQPITHMVVDRPRGAFAVLVPLVPEADHVALMGQAVAGTTAVGASAESTPSVELHSISLEAVLS